MTVICLVNWWFTVRYGGGNKCFPFPVYLMGQLLHDGLRQLVCQLCICYKYDFYWQIILFHVRSRLHLRPSSRLRVYSYQHPGSLPIATRAVHHPTRGSWSFCRRLAKVVPGLVPVLARAVRCLTHCSAARGDWEYSSVRFRAHLPRWRTHTSFNQRELFAPSSGDGPVKFACGHRPLPCGESVAQWRHYGAMVRRSVGDALARTRGLGTTSFQRCQSPQVRLQVVERFAWCRVCQRRPPDGRTCVHIGKLWKQQLDRIIYEAFRERNCRHTRSASFIVCH